ncbi:Gfo/Idh/MocA family protein [Zavarzinella formosa]|uniref:Gfo/Idh/MocA family protein n=1 Tax=Zavarzinella formosa TaxID=360055 RepID=UPI00037429D1|nr:Gfo/Idh/MocA family oxidoreductase [Zavarzinella formosa]
MRPSFYGQDKIRYAVVGAGWFGQVAVLPAFENAENSELVAIVSGDVEKRAILSQEYDVPAYPYEELEDLMESGTIDAVYLVTPNSKHREHTLMAARHGIHVLCEKPLADTVHAAREMKMACEDADVKLMTAYRLHFEPMNLLAIELTNDGTIGEPRLFSSINTQVIDEGNARLIRSLGGHPLLDIGIYCVNAARYLFRDEPEEVSAYAATSADPRFRQVPEMVSAVMRFPGERLAMISCGFGESKVSHAQLIGTKGDIRMNPAFSFAAKRRLTLTVGKDTKKQDFPAQDQVAPQIVYFSECILNDRQPEPDADEAIADLLVIEAMILSIERGIAIPLQPTIGMTRPNFRQLITRPAVREPELVNAAAPSDD